MASSSLLKNNRIRGEGRFKLWRFLRVSVSSGSVENRSGERSFDAVHEAHIHGKEPGRERYVRSDRPLRILRVIASATRSYLRGILEPGSGGDEVLEFGVLV